MLLKTLLFAALLLSSRAAEIITKDGGILLLVDSSSQTVSIATKAEYTNAQITTMHQAMTMAQVQTIVDAMKSELQGTIDNLVAKLANVSSDLIDYEDRIQELEEQNFQQSRTLTSLETGKANTEAVRTDADIRTVVDGMVGTAASNALKSTLDQKVNKENQYDDDSVRTLLALIVNANPADSSALRTALDAIAGRVKSIESELDASCGDAVCSPGSFVKTACNPGTDPAVARECDICASGKYSFGGLVNTCLTCADCNAGFHEVQACSTVSNRVCAKCTQCVPGATFESQDCTALQDRVCLACTGTCAANEWLEESCSVTANTKCTACSTCGDDEDVVLSCTATTDTLCERKQVGFLADLGASRAITTTGAWTPISGFTTDDTLGGTFVRPGTTFDGTTFTTPRLGYYLLAFNIRIDGMSNSWFHVSMFRNNGGNLNAQGLSTLRGSTNYDYWSFSTCGVVKTAANTKYAVNLYSIADTSYTIHTHSGFAAFELFPEEGVFAIPSADTTVTKTGITTLSSWSTTQTHSFLTGGAFAGATGEYTVQNDGIFILAASIRFNSVLSQAGSFVRTFIDINDKNEFNSGLHSVQGQPHPSDYMVLHAQGAALLVKGDKITPKVESSKDNAYTAGGQSHFSAVRLNTSYGFAADLSANTAVAANGYTPLNSNWRTSGTKGLFDQGEVFDEKSGLFTAPVAGWYYAAANIRFDGVGAVQYMEVSIRSSMDTTLKDHGIYAVQAPVKGQSGSAQNTLNPVGVTYMAKGATLGIWVRVQTTGSPFVQTTTGFSAVLLHEDMAAV